MSTLGMWGLVVLAFGVALGYSLANSGGYLGLDTIRPEWIVRIVWMSVLVSGLLITLL